MIAKIVDKKIIATDTINITLAKPAGLNFEAGQYFIFTIPNPDFADPRGPQRLFSLIYEYDENTFSIATRLTGSPFKEALAKLEIGAEVEVKNVHGGFVLPRDERKIIFLVGGIGITPVISMLRFARSQGINLDAKLIYSNRNEDSSPFLEELKTFATEQEDFELINVFTQSGDKYIDKEFIQNKVGDYGDRLFYLVGPPRFVLAMNGILRELEINPENIIREEFSGYN